MKRKHRRLAILGLIGLALSGATALVLTAFSDNLVFFYTPSEAASRGVAPDRRIRLGGLVETGSIERGPDGVTVQFRITDLKQAAPVSFRGVLPDLFRENQGVVAEGSFDTAGLFRAREVLARHDESYMPPEVAKALKESGQWRPAPPGAKP